MSPKKRPDRNTVIDELINYYLLNYFKLINGFDAIPFVKDEVERETNHQLKQAIVDKFNEDAGIVGGAMLFADNVRNSFEMLQEDEIDAAVRSVFHIKWRFQGKEAENYKILMEAMLQSTVPGKSFLAQNIFQYPKYFINLPNSEVKSSFPNSNFEEKIIAEQNINYLICLVEELNFFNYAWRVLHRLAEIYGLNAVFEPEMILKHRDKTAIIYDLSAIENWKGYEHLPEVEWLKFLEKHQEHPQWVKAYKKWGELKKKHAGSPIDKQFNVVSEWKSLGFVSTTGIELFDSNTVINFRQMLKFSVELFQKNLKEATNDEDINLLKKSFEAIDNMIFEEGQREGDPIAISKIVREKWLYEHIHVAFSKCLMSVLDIELSGWQSSPLLANVLSHGNRTIGNLLTILHIKSRAPIIPSYWLNLLSGEGKAHDYFVFPLLVSNAYPIDSQDLNKGAGEMVLLNRVVLMLAYVDPIWLNNAFEDKGFKLKDETLKTVEGFKINQLFYSRITRKIIDSGFYDNYFKKSVQIGEWSANYDVFLHNVKLQLAGTIRAIDKGKQKEATESLHFLISALELSRWAFKPEEYLKSNKHSISNINLSDKLTETIGIVIDDLMHNNGRLINIGNGTVLKELKDRNNRKRLFKTNVTTNLIIRSYPVIVQVILKDIIANGIAHGIDAKHIDKIDPEYLIEIELFELEDSWVQFIVKNRKRMQPYIVDILVEGKNDADSASDIPWGVLITSCYCQALDYKISVIDDHMVVPQTTVNIFFRKECIYE